MYLITLPQPKVIAVPKNLKFLAIPFYELYENAQAYGPQLAALPHYLARYRFEYVDENGNVVAETPGLPPSQGARTGRDDPRYFQSNGSAPASMQGQAMDVDSQQNGHEMDGAGDAAEQ